VQRDFECSRLANDFQARAYEQVLPLAEGVPPETAAQQFDVADAHSQQVIQGGIAA
jgi:hypothetical protein